MFLLAPQVLTAWFLASALLSAMLAGGMLTRVVAVIGSCIALPFFVNFCFDVVEKTALGYDRPPPFSRLPQGSVLRLLRLLVYLSIVSLVVRITPDAFRWISLSVILAITPAVMAFIVFHEPLLRALHPVRIWQFVSNMGISYLTLRLVTTSMLFVGLYALRREFEFMLTVKGIALGAAGFFLLLLLMCRLVGRLIHLRRAALGLNTHFSEEQREQDRQHEHRLQIEQEAGELSLTCRRDGFEVAWTRLEQSAKRHAFRDDRLYLDALGDLSDRRLLYRFASGYIERHLPGETSHCWHLLLTLYRESQGRFRFHSGSTLLAMAETADRREEREIMLELLGQFDETFPDHPRTREALLKGAEFALDAGGDARARQLIDRVDAVQGVVDESKLAHVRRQLQ